MDGSAALADELASLSYRDLQTRAKAAGLPASGRASDIIARLLDADAGVYSPMPSSSKARRPAAGVTPRATAAGVTPRASLLKAAASTPLPAGQRERRGGADQEEEHFAAAEDEQPVLTLPRRQQRKAAPNAAATTPFFRLLLLTALVAAVAALVVPYCQHADCPALARSLPELARSFSGDVMDSMAVAYSSARVQAWKAVEQAQRQWQLMATKAGLGAASTSGSRTAACHMRAVGTLRSILPEGDQWRNLLATASDMLGGRGRPGDKAATALFVCEVPVDCQTAIEDLSVAVEGSGSCLLAMDAKQLGGDKGAFQKQLCEFIVRSPTGFVVLNRVDQMSPELLPVLINALSEHGAFELDGKPVSTAGATFLLTSHMDGEVFEHVREDIRFTQDVKSQLVVGFVERAQDAENTKRQAKALRRRIDVVLPIGSDPEGPEGDDQEQPPPSSCHLDAAAALRTLLPEGEDWEDLRDAAAAALGPRDSSQATAAALLVCEVPEDCATAVNVVEAAASHRACFLRLEGARLRNENIVKKVLTTFLAKQPKGTVLVNRLDQMPVDMLGLLEAATQPGGSLRLNASSDAVFTTDATILFTALMPSDVFNNVENEVMFKSDTLLHLKADLERRAVNERTTSILAKALMQRIRFSLPIGSSQDGDGVEMEAGAG